jgi:hypothetical protein
MELFKQICTTFAEKRIHYADALETHFDIILDALWTHCLAYGKRASSLGEEDLKELHRETAEYLVQRFQNQAIDIKEIHMENSESVIQKFISAFIFVFQQRLVEKIKQQNQSMELLVELLEELEKQGIEEADLGEIDKFHQGIASLMEKQKVSQTNRLVLEFICAKFNTWWLNYKDLIDADAEKTRQTEKENSISQLKLLLEKKRITNRKALEGILLNV